MLVVFIKIISIKAPTQLLDMNISPFDKMQVVASHQTLALKIFPIFNIKTNSTLNLGQLAIRFWPNGASLYKNIIVQIFLVCAQIFLCNQTNKNHNKCKQCLVFHVLNW